MQRSEPSPDYTAEELFNQDVRNKVAQYRQDRRGQMRRTILRWLHIRKTEKQSGGVMRTGRPLGYMALVGAAIAFIGLVLAGVANVPWWLRFVLVGLDVMCLAIIGLLMEILDTLRRAKPKAPDKDEQ